MRTFYRRAILICLGLLVAPFCLSTLFAQSSIISQAVPAPVISVGNTAWMLVATALVLLMTIPGLAFFYGGLVRSKNILSILMQCLVLLAAISIEWIILGYSVSFGSSGDSLAPYWGGLKWSFLSGINPGDVCPYFVSMSHDRIPHIVFIMYQCMFAVITPALIIGAFAERIKFKGFLIFSLCWAILVYNPVAHWIWSTDGWMFKKGVLDFAGGIVVHVNAGIAALVMAVMIGRRKGEQPVLSHNIPFVLLGTGLLWFGWFGFNAGSGLAADGLAANAFMVTHVAAATAALIWGIMDWFLNKKPTTIGMCTGAIAGLAAITPAAGFVDVKAAMLIATVSSMVCFYMVGTVKAKLKYDDSLDAFGVHGVGGIIGSLLLGVFANPAIQPAYSGWYYGNHHQLTIQLMAVGVCIVFTGAMTYLLFRVVDKLVGIKASDYEESEGLDTTQHNETAYTDSE
jgi:ammonium transporter, Amt family